MKDYLIKIFIAGMLVFSCQWQVNALSSDTESRKPEIKFNDNTTVVSDTMDFELKTSVVVFMDNVTVTNSQYTLKCNKLRMLPDKENRIESLQAEGNVSVKAKNGMVTCKKATYLRSSGKLILEYNVALHQEDNILSADKVTVIIREGKFDGIHGEGNVRGSFSLEEILQEEKNETTDKDNSKIP